MVEKTSSSTDLELFQKSELDNLINSIETIRNLSLNPEGKFKSYVECF